MTDFLSIFPKKRLYYDKFPRKSAKAGKRQTVSTGTIGIHRHKMTSGRQKDKAICPIRMIKAKDV